VPFTIRAFTEDDLPAATVIRNLPGARWGTLATPYESLERWRKHRAANPQSGNLHLVACQAGQVIGTAMLFPNQLKRRAHVASIGINIHDDWVGKGAGTALFAALIDAADNWFGLKRLELHVYTDNPAAIALYQKFGFEIEGREIQDAFRDGAYVDSYIMSRLRGDLPKDTSAPPPRPEPAPAGPVTLRAAEPEDLHAITALMNLPGVRHGTLRTPFVSPDELKHLTNPADPSTKSVLAIQNDTPIGIGMLTVAKGRRAHIGDVALMAVHDAHTANGIGTSLLNALIDTADNWLNLRRLTLSVFADNKPAITAYTRAGFIPEATLRADAFRNGAYADAVAVARVR
jgi:putative acetyltransferase